MQDLLGESLSKLRKSRIRKTRTIALLLVLSLIVSMDVFWILRKPGLTLAGNADCGIVEHTHDAGCQDGDTPCPLTEHTHTIDCYSDQTADTETQLEWQKTFADYPYTGDLQKDLVGIAKMQVGYTESHGNFVVADDGVRRGYTRYGAWYGAPYSDWSAMFVSFCLHYAGADPNEFPINTGAVSMAIQWRSLGKYINAGAYHPSPGDLVFFTDNTVGIVSEVQTATMYVIRGDHKDAVSNDLVILSDASIAGWGLTGDEDSTVLENTAPTPPTEIPLEDGTTISIIEGKEFVPLEHKAALGNAASIIDLLAYLEANEGNYFFTLMNLNNVELPKDASGNYIATAGESYKLALTFTSPEGFLPGTYQYQVPNGLMVDGGEGTFILKDGTEVGSWVVTDTGLITLEFNEHMNSRTDITISATLGIHFPDQEEPIDFDGKITVRVEAPPPQSNPTALQKWGQPDADNGKLDWFVLIYGYSDSQIPGNILTDQIGLPDWGKPHSYTQSDIDAGLTFGVTDANGGWHNWTVTTDDPHLLWDENGWSYKIPHTVVCDYCGELELGNNGWIYQVSYSSTPTPLNTPGNFSYENKVTVDGQTAWGWNYFVHGQIEAQVIKNGTFVSDASGGGFLWEVMATIPGRPEGVRAEYSWAISDEMRLLDASGVTVARIPNDIHLATVVATYNGTTIQIPRIQDATDQDLFAWDNAWTSEGVPSTRTINLLCRCQCTPETCHWGGCGEYWYQNDAGTWIGTRDFCQCWTETQNTTFTLVYKTTDLSTIEAYGALGYKVSNQAQLYYIDENYATVQVDYDDAVVDIPNLFSKQLTHDFDGYTANYKITINESKLVLTDGSPLYIRDAMTSTLTYISGSLIITAEDINGNVVTLKQGTDFTVTYDGTGKQKDDEGNIIHVLDIVILHPQPVMYTLDYDTTLIFPDQVTGGIKYSNSAEVTMWGESIKDTAPEKIYADINIAAKNYMVKMIKTAAKTGAPLADAVFGLFNEHGGQITSAATNVHGELDFKSNITQGIILREHILYYMQELRAPPGYLLDDTEYWFCFCNEITDSCEICNEILAGLNGVRIPFEQIGNVRITNELMKYEFPETGGPGVYPLLLVSVVMLITPLVYISVRRRKRERRDGG